MILSLNDTTRLVQDCTVRGFILQHFLLFLVCGSEKSYYKHCLSMITRRSPFEEIVHAGNVGSRTWKAAIYTIFYRLSMLGGEHEFTYDDLVMKLERR